MNNEPISRPGWLFGHDLPAGLDITLRHENRTVGPPALLAQSSDACQHNDSGYIGEMSFHGCQYFANMAHTNAVVGNLEWLIRQLPELI
jgi:hypothetical protein